MHYAHIAYSYAARDSQNRSRVTFRNCTDGTESISFQAQGEAFMSESNRLVTPEAAKALRFAVYGAWSEDNPLGLKP